MSDMYDKEKMQELELQLRQVIMGWPKVASGTFNGCPAFLAAGTVFCFLVTDAVVITNMAEKTRYGIEMEMDSGDFHLEPAQDEPWKRISLASHRFTEILPYIEQAYHFTMNDLDS